MSTGWRWAVVLLASGAPGGAIFAAILPSQVLVVYNSQAADASSVLNAYLAAHPDIPAANVLDVNDATIAGVANVTYADFVNKIRNPIRTYLNRPGDPTPIGVISIVLIKGLPHRIFDTDNATVGDVPTSASAEFGSGDYTAASVDAELVLLYQDLETGEAGQGMDSYSDNVIDNPYHKSTTGIDGIDRRYITNAKTFTNPYDVFWTFGGTGKTRLTAGDIYLVCRIDANTAADAVAMIERARNVRVNRAYARIVLDEDVPILNPNPPPTWLHPEYDNVDLFTPPNSTYFYAGNDYEETRDLMRAAGWKVEFDETTTFILPAALPRPIIAYASYGENHIDNPPGAGTYLQGFRFVRGAIFNTTESYNGRAFNGLGTLFDQAQVADFIGLGGTFGIGHVWEPLAFTVPDNEYLLANFLKNGLTWAEAAYSALPVLSWMQIVIGDPLATATIVDQPADFDADLDVDQADALFITPCLTGAAVTPPASGCEDADIDHWLPLIPPDEDVDQTDFGLFQRCLSGAGVTADPDCRN